MLELLKTTMHILCQSSIVTHHHPQACWPDIPVLGRNCTQVNSAGVLSTVTRVITRARVVSRAFVRVISRALRVARLVLQKQQQHRKPLVYCCVSVVQKHRAC